MVTGDDYENRLAEYVRKIAEAAIRWQLDDWGFGQEASGGRVGNGEPGGVVWPPIADGPTADITYEGETINPGRDVYQPWFRSIERHFACFKEIPDPKGFDAGVAAIEKALTMFTLHGQTDVRNGESGFTPSDGSLTGNIQVVADALAGQTSDMVLMYTKTYGPMKMTILFENLRQAVLVANCALLAEQKMWHRAREDVIALARDAETSFNARGGESKISPWNCILAVAEAVKELLPKAANDALNKALPIVKTATDLLTANEGGNPDPVPALDGSSHLEVEDSLVAAIGDLKERIHVAEDLVHDMSRQMVQAMRTEGPSPFHIHGSVGLSKKFTDAAAEIRIDVDVLRRVGTAYVPDVVWVAAKAVDIMMDAAGDGPWERGDWSVGDGGRARGAFNDLLEVIYTFVNSSGAEMVEAGSILAEHAGAIGDVDQQIGEHLDETAQEVDEGTPSGDVSPQLAPQPGVSADQQYSDDAPIHGRLASRLGG
ncbi:hypothetical protein SAMN05428985_103700 [Nocardioides sp. YR527]|uniref:hypothetical protein n=1 Tax=Nocardioides sp. YR527 TaxID=1881028 RepID=UPI000883132F|nr:hypothetical protein [Nocardioides sp. YR527]SDK34853.1 hypothetical protein SAMN05428985_103700 [Nocardioides sp. YR527]